jgi:hypothetical protein
MMWLIPERVEQVQKLSALKKEDDGDDEKMRDSDGDLREDTDDRA